MSRKIIVFGHLSLFDVYFFLKNPFFVEKNLEKKLSFCKKKLEAKRFGKRKRLKTNLAKENLSKKKPFEQKLNSFEKRPIFLKKQNKTSNSLEIKNNRFGKKPTL